MIDEEQLKQIICDIESHSIERTTSLENTDKFCQTICAFPNDVSGSGKKGSLLLGVHDNGKLSGLKSFDKPLLLIE